MLLGRFLYFFLHPSEYIGLWTLDATVVFSVLTLLVVLRQLALMTEQSRLMRHQDALVQRQTEIVVRQDETNRELLSRRARLHMYVQVLAPRQAAVCCRNDGNKTAQNFYWHCLVPLTVDGNAVWDSTGSRMLFNTSSRSHNGELYRVYGGLISDPLYPTRTIRIAQLNTTDQTLGLWWTTVSEDGADPMPDGTMQRMEREQSKP